MHHTRKLREQASLPFEERELKMVMMMKQMVLTQEYHHQRLRELKSISDNIRFLDIFYSGLSNQHTLRAFETILSNQSDF